MYEQFMGDFTYRDSASRQVPLFIRFVRFRATGSTKTWNPESGNGNGIMETETESRKRKRNGIRNQISMIENLRISHCII